MHGECLWFSRIFLGTFFRHKQNLSTLYNDIEGYALWKAVILMTVYADVLVAVNYIINLLILIASNKILGFILSRKRICLSALVGAVGSLVIFLPYIGWWFQLLFKLVLSLVMAACAFGFRPWKRLAKSIFVLFTVSFLFAGMLLVVSYLIKPINMLFYNGVVYFDIPIILLIAATTVAYLLLLLFERLFFSRTSEKKLYEISVMVNGKTIAVKGLADTGCHLKEPFSGAPVIVCDKELTKRIAPNDDTRFRIIPCFTVTGQGTLHGFRPDEVTIIGDNFNKKTKDVYIAASNHPIDGEYQALLNPQLVDRS